MIKEKEEYVRRKKWTNVQYEVYSRTPDDDEDLLHSSGRS
jgi:hypothetical protein